MDTKPETECLAETEEATVEEHKDEAEQEAEEVVQLHVGVSEERTDEAKLGEAKAEPEKEPSAEKELSDETELSDEAEQKDGIEVSHDMSFESEISEELNKEDEPAGEAEPREERLLAANEAKTPEDKETVTAEEEKATKGNKADYRNNDTGESDKQLSSELQVLSLQVFNLEVLSGVREIRVGLRDTIDKLTDPGSDDEDPRSPDGITHEQKNNLLEKLRGLESVAKRLEVKLKQVQRQDKTEAVIVEEHETEPEMAEDEATERKILNLHCAHLDIFDGMRELLLARNELGEQLISNEGPTDKMNFEQKTNILLKLRGLETHAQLLQEKLKQVQIQMEDLDSSLRFTERVDTLGREFSALARLLSEQADSIDRLLFFTYCYLREDSNENEAKEGDNREEQIGDERKEEVEGEEGVDKNEEVVGGEVKDEAREEVKDEVRKVETESSDDYLEQNKYEQEVDYFDENVSEEEEDPDEKKEKERIRIEMIKRIFEENKDEAMFSFSTEFF